MKERIWQFLDDRALVLARGYFDPDGPFASVTFDALEPNEPNDVSASDLLALNLLDVRPSPRFIRWALGPGRSEIAAQLRLIPPDLTLWDASDAQIGDDSPPDRLWHRIQEQDRVGYVTAGKLLARKRPHLIPVYDSVIRDALGRPENVWLSLRDALDESIRQRLLELRKAAELSDGVSLIRVLDIVIWMRNSGSRNAIRVRGDRIAPIR